MTSKKSPNNVSLRKTKEVIMTNQSATPREATVALWPEWNDQDVNSEKWDSSQKPKEKTKSPAQSSSYFIDPETQVLYPPSIVPACTRRPQEFITDKTPVVYDPECVNHIDLLYCNEHLFNIEILRWITCEIQNLWLACRTPVTTSTLAAVSNQTETNEFTVMNPSSSPVYTYEWKPWEHIYAMTKITKDNVNTPQYNPYGKYIVKLYWMGCWRKIIVDDLIPFDEEDRPLLPQTKQPHELWPMLLTKALLKIASVDCRSAYSTGEMGDFSTIQCLTGWIKHTIVVKKESTEKLWDYLSNYLTDWERPDDVMKRVEKLMKLEQTETTEKVEHRDVVNSKSAISKEKSKDKKGGDKSKESAKEKKDQTTAHISSDEVNPKIPETLLFASFKNIVSSLACLTASESKTAFKIKEFGFTCSDAYPICVAKRRVIPIIPPSPEKPTPTWKLIRPRPPDFPFNSCDNQSVTDKEKEPIRSLLLWTPVQEHIFYEPEKIVANPSVSTAESSYTSGSSPDTGRQTAGAVKGRSGSQGPLGRRRKESATTIQSSTKYPKRASREDIHKKGSGGKSKEVKGGNLTETVGSRSSNSLQLSRIKSNAEETASEILPVKSVSVTSPKEIWLDISDFCEIFRTVDIYHKPNTYSIVRTHSNLKPSDTSPSVHYLLCDSIHPCEIILQLSVVYQWPLPVVKTFSPSYSRGFSYIPETEATITVPTNEHHSTHNLPVITTTSASYTGDFISHSRNNSPDDSHSTTNEAKQPVMPTDPPSTLLVEYYHWNESRQGDPIKRLETTGSRAMSLLLPSNRHCYKLSISAPLGYVFTVLARLRSSSAENSDSPAKGLQSINILFGDSNHILTNGISTCPLMIRYYANQVISSMVSIGTHLEALVSLNESRNHQIIESINNNQMKPDKASTSGSLISSLELDELEYKTLENLENKQRELKELLAIWPNLKLFKPILLSILQSLIGDNGTADMNFAWRILQMDYTTVNPFKVFYGHDTISNPPPATITKQKSKASGSRGEKTVQPVKANTVEETFINRWSKPVDPNILIAVVRIQSLFRGHRIRSATLLNQTRFIVETLSSTNSQSDTENTETKSKFFMRKILLRKIKRLTNGWMNCLNILQQGHNQYEVGNELIQRLILSNSSVVNNCAIQTRLIEDLNLYLSVKEYSGTYFEIPSEYPMHNTGPSNYAEKPTSIFYKDWIHLLFRDCIYLPNSMNNVPMVSEKVKYSIQMKTALPHSYILLINNDNGVTVRPSVDFPYTWLHLPENNMGYSLLGVAGSGPAPNGKWSLQILGPGIMGTERLPKPANASSQSLCSNFHILELEDYYEPNSSGLLFRRRICAINDSLITVQLRLSVPNVYTRLCIKMGNKEVVFDDGYGGACIFAYMLLSDTMSSDGRKSRASNSGRLLEASKTEVIKSSPREVTNPKLTAVKSNTARVSPRKSTTPKKNIKPGSGSSSSTGGSTVGSSGGSSGISSAHNERNSRPVSSEPISAQLQGDKENTLKDEDRYYWIEAFVDVKQWPLSISNWSFLEERRLAKLEECQVNNQSRSASADKSSSGRTVKSATKSAGGKSSGVGQKSGSGRGNSAKIDVNQAHWKIRIICNNSSDVKLINADSRTAEIKALKRAWEEVEPGRSMRGELSRTRYLEEYGLMNRPDLIDDTESVITAKSDDSQIQTAREQPLTDPSSDPSRIYVLTFPQELNRTVSHVKPVELQKFTMKPDEVELNRIDEASKLVGPNTEQWFIASHYLQQVQLLPNNDMDKMIKVKREIFNKLMHNLEMELADHKKKRGLCQQNHIVMLKIAQFLNDEAHFKYYDMCTTYRNNLIKQYKEEKEALLNESADYSAVEPLVSQQKSPKKERIKSSRSSKSGSKSRPSSIKRRS